MSPRSAGARRLLTIARDLGYLAVRTTRRGGHILLVHRETQNHVTIPLYVSEDGRNFDNYRTQLVRSAEQDTRGQPHVDGERRAKTATGAGREVAERRALRIENAQRERQSRHIERRDRSMKFYAGLMGGRWI